jgi:hypothetical protein
MAGTLRRRKCQKITYSSGAKFDQIFLSTALSSEEKSTTHAMGAIHRVGNTKVIAYVPNVQFSCSCFTFKNSSSRPSRCVSYSMCSYISNNKMVNKVIFDKR